MIMLIGLLYFKTAWNASVVKVLVYSNNIALAFSIVRFISVIVACIAPTNQGWLPLKVQLY